MTDGESDKRLACAYEGIFIGEVLDDIPRRVAQMAKDAGEFHEREPPADTIEGSWLRILGNDLLLLRESYRRGVADGCFTGEQRGGIEAQIEGVIGSLRGADYDAALRTLDIVAERMIDETKAR